MQYGLLIKKPHYLDSEYSCSNGFIIADTLEILGRLEHRIVVIQVFNVHLNLHLIAPRIGGNRIKQYLFNGSKLRNYTIYLTFLNP